MIVTIAIAMEPMMIMLPLLAILNVLNEFKLIDTIITRNLVAYSKTYVKMQINKLLMNSSMAGIRNQHMYEYATYMPKRYLASRKLD